MAWPEATDYNEAIQNPATCFHDDELRRGQPAVNALGLPVLCSGNFAAVYQLTHPDGRAWAVKCFTREVAGLRERYQAISDHLARAKLPFAVDFQYLEKGILVRGQWYAVVKMRWVEGLTLNQFLKDHADQPRILERLAQLWLKLAQQLRRADIGHADLQHGNVLLVPSTKTSVLSVRLIDYDGMFVPPLADRPSAELGHANYQHPQRATQKIWNADLDRFSHLVIYAALRALIVGGSGLWNRYDNGENLLFREKDLREPATSPLLHELWKLPDPGLHTLVKRLIVATAGPIADVPTLADLVGDGEGSGPQTAIQKDGKAAALPVALPAAERKRPRGDRPRPDAAASPLPWLLIGGIGLGVLGLFIVCASALSFLLLAGGSASTPPVPDRVWTEPDKKLRDGGGGGQQDWGNKVPPLPRLLPLNKTTVAAGQTVTVAIKVDRQKFKGLIELHVFEQFGGPKEGKGGGMGIKPPPVGLRPPEPPERQVVVPRSLTILASKSSVDLNISAGKEVGDETREYGVAIVNVPGGGPRGGGMGQPPGAPVGLPPDGGKPAEEVLERTFTLVIKGAPRSLPTVLPVAGGKGVQLDVLDRGLLGYETDVAGYQVFQSRLGGPPFALGGKGMGDGEVPVVAVLPARLVVVHAKFPLRAQLEELRKALRLLRLEDLSLDNANAAPFRGLNVLRCELGPNGQPGKWEPLYEYHAGQDRVLVDFPTGQVLRAAFYDDDHKNACADALIPGLATPLPVPAWGDYPPIQLPGLAGGGPGGALTRLPQGFGYQRPALGALGPGTIQGKYTTRRVAADLAPAPLREKFAGKLDPFAPLSRQEALGKEFGPGSRIPGGKEMVGGLPPEEGLVRFVDAGVKPGVTYQYHIRVRLANPYYQKPQRLAKPADADPRELLSEPTLTPPVRVPPDWHFYAVDQPPTDFRVKTLKGIDLGPTPPDKAAVQVHQWQGDFKPKAGGVQGVAAWVIAERLLLSRGDPLGRRGVEAEVPVWNVELEIFEQAGQTQVPGVTKSPRPAVPLDFAQPEGGSVLVDFEGGRGSVRHYRSGPYDDKINSSLELLYLAPDGKLRLRNSRDDALDNGPARQERERRLEETRQHMHDVRSQAGGGRDMPKGLDPPFKKSTGKPFGPPGGKS